MRFTSGSFSSEFSKNKRGSLCDFLILLLNSKGCGKSTERIWLDCIKFRIECSQVNILTAIFADSQVSLGCEWFECCCGQCHCCFPFVLFIHVKYINFFFFRRLFSKKSLEIFSSFSSPYRSRTGVPALRGPCPRPLDEGTVARSVLLHLLHLCGASQPFQLYLFSFILLPLPDGSDGGMLTPSRNCETITACVVIRAGFEPATWCLEGICSIQLSYRTMIFI